MKRVPSLPSCKQKGTGLRLGHLISSENRGGFSISNMILSQENNLLSHASMLFPFIN